MSKVTEQYTVECPYLSGRQWKTKVSLQPNITVADYELLLEKGFRRLGALFYSNVCEDCRHCLPLRVDVNSFKKSRSQQRIWLKNKDLKVNIIDNPQCTDEFYDLYCDYLLKRHNQLPPSKAYFEQQFFFNFDFYKLLEFRHNSKLVMLSWLDKLVMSTNSIYCVYDMKMAGRGLGIYSILWELELSKSLNLSWYYLGYWAGGATNLDYKSQFYPHQLLLLDRWHEVNKNKHLKGNTVPRPGHSSSQS